MYREFTDNVKGAGTSIEVCRLRNHAKDHRNVLTETYNLDVSSSGIL